MGKEIERKWLPDPDWVRQVTEGVSPLEIAQGYLCRSPVLRIRKENESYYLTYKGSGLMEHEEYNLPLTREAFEELLVKCSGKIIRKKRFCIPLSKLVLAQQAEDRAEAGTKEGGRTGTQKPQNFQDPQNTPPSQDRVHAPDIWEITGPQGKLLAEIDVFESPIPDLALLEIEFPSRQEAETFKAPPFLGQEVTQNPAYYNAVMSL